MFARAIRPLAVLALALVLSGAKCGKHHDSSSDAPPEEVPTVVFSAPPDSSTSTTPDPSGLLALINAHRANRGLSQLAMAPGGADAIMTAYAALVAATGQIQPLPHNLDGTSRSRLARAGINPPDHGLSEILQISKDASTLEGYLESAPGYSSVIDYRKWNNLAVGYAMGAGGWYWVLVFYQ